MGEFFKKYIKKEHFLVQPLKNKLFFKFYDKYLKKIKILSANLKFRTAFKNCVYDALKNRYKETEFENEWDLYWIEKELIHVHNNNNNLKKQIFIK